MPFGFLPYPDNSQYGPRMGQQPAGQRGGFNPNIPSKYVFGGIGSGVPLGGLTTAQPNPDIPLPPPMDPFANSPLYSFGSVLSNILAGYGQQQQPQVPQAPQPPSTPVQESSEGMSGTAGRRGGFYPNSLMGYDPYLLAPMLYMQAMSQRYTPNMNPYYNALWSSSQPQILPRGSGGF